MVRVLTGCLMSPFDRVGKRRRRRQKTRQSSRRIPRIVEHVVDDLTLHHDSKQEFQNIIGMGRQNPFLEAAAA